MSFDLGRVFPNLIGLIIFLPIIAFAQGQERSIDKLSWRTEPIKILKLKTKDKEVELGKKFLEEDDWLKGLTVTVQNISDKAIARIEIELAFPRPGGGTKEKPTLVAAMIYGLDPAESGAETLKLVLPGESVDIKLLDAAY